jgi:hypothetical protein
VLVVPHHGLIPGEVRRGGQTGSGCGILFERLPRDTIRSPGQKTTDVYGKVGAQVYVTACNGYASHFDGEIYGQDGRTP